jgi:glycosyltransferase involved in cell wall biosynthesis
MTSISVVIPTAGRRLDLLKRAIDSVCNQSRPPLEIVVIWDSPTAIPDFGPLYDELCRFVRNTGSPGPAAARNAGIQESLGDYIALLDDDDYWAPNKLELQAALIDDQGLPAVLGTAAVNVASDGRRQVTPTVPPRDGESYLRYLFDRPSLFQHRGFCTPTLLVPRNAALDTPYDETLTQFEDVDWLLRLCESHPFRYTMAPLTTVRGAPSYKDSSRQSTVGSGARLLSWASQRRTSWGDERLLHNFVSYFVVRELAVSGETRAALRLWVQHCWPRARFLAALSGFLCLLVRRGRDSRTLALARWAVRFTRRLSGFGPRRLAYGRRLNPEAATLKGDT